VLQARDNFVELADTLVKRYGSVSAAQKELNKAQRTLSRDLTRFERRGATARNDWERELRRTRTQIERELRQRREVVTKRASAVTDVIGGQIKATGEQVKTLV